MGVEPASEGSTLSTQSSRLRTPPGPGRTQVRFPHSGVVFAYGAEIVKSISGERQRYRPGTNVRRQKGQSCAHFPLFLRG